MKNHKVDIISINKTMKKESKQTKTKTSCTGVEKAVLNGTKSHLKIFLHFLYEE